MHMKIDYLDADELAFMKAHYGKDGQARPALIARVSTLMKSGAAREWMARFCEYAGTKPATHAKIRLANQAEPGLLTGTFITDDIAAFIAAAMNSLGPKPA